jgi:hypothetical protein
MMGGMHFEKGMFCFIKREKRIAGYLFIHYPYLSYTEAMGKLRS